MKIKTQQQLEQIVANNQERVDLRRQDQLGLARTLAERLRTYVDRLEGEAAYGVDLCVQELFGQVEQFRRESRDNHTEWKHRERIVALLTEAD